MKLFVAPFTWMETSLFVDVLLVFLCCPLLSSAQPPHASSKILVERFNSETPAAWEIVESADEASGTIKATTQIQKYLGGKLVKSEDKAVVIRRRSGHFRFEPAQSKNGVTILLVQNPQYSFSLSREDGKTDWIVNEFALKGEKTYGDIPPDIVQYLKPNGYSYIVLLGPLSKMVKENNFQIIKAETIEDLVRIHYETFIPVPNQNIKINGKMDFDPNNSWALRRSEFLTSTGGIIKISKEFQLAINNDYKPCKSWKSLARSTDDDSETRRETQFELIDTSLPSEDNFYLSAFGFSEPMGVKPPPSGKTFWFLWFTGIACVLLILGEILRRHIKRLRDPIKVKIREESKNK